LVSNGSATAYVTGGNSPYNYSWSNGSNSPFINGLTAGTYTFLVNDGSGCIATYTVAITQPQQIVISTWTIPDGQGTPNCNGTATAYISGGTSPYSYAWSDGQTTQTATGLCSGSYSVTVTDIKQCTQSISVTITSNVGINELSATPIPIINIYPNPITGTFTLSIEGMQNTEMHVTVFNILGDVVEHERAKVISSPYLKQFNLGIVSKGIYFIQVNLGEKIINRKIIIE
jgi:hypothetical protein